MKVIILSGISGSGKTTFLKALEDAGHFCVDNLPLVLLQKFLEVYSASEPRLAPPAFVIDIREREFFGVGKDMLKDIKTRYDVEVVFLESQDEVLLRRYKETRRAHPLYDMANIKDALDKEREEISLIKDLADKGFVISGHVGTRIRTRRAGQR